MSSIAYTRGKVIFAGSADWSSPAQVYRVLLATSAYAAARGHRHVSEVVGELAGGGYARQDIVARALLPNDETGGADAVADAVTFAHLRSTQSYRWAIVFRVGKTDADSDLICAIDMGEVALKGTTDHTIRWDGQPTSGLVFSIQ